MNAIWHAREYLQCSSMGRNQNVVTVDAIAGVKQVLDQMELVFWLHRKIINYINMEI